ncbi:putative bifunctional diguanylate cyclase/phosphodiesterase [Vasconcelosia minhoensis]|nr:EAL domain-containing protein [Romeria gracilis]
MKQIKRRPYGLVSLLVTGLLLGLGPFVGLSMLELAVFDQMTRSRPDRGPDPRLLIVEITEADIRAQGRWPLSDQTLADLIATLQSYHPRVIGLDIYRDIPFPPGQEALRQQLQSPNLVTITGLGVSTDSAVPPPPGLDPDQVGFNDFVIDPDGILRRNFMFTMLGEEELYSFALQLSRQYLQPENSSLSADADALTLGQTKFLALTSEAGGYTDMSDAGYQILLNYRSADRVARRVTLSQVLDQKLKPEWIEDRVVLIGATAPSLKDFFYTPYSLTAASSQVMPGVVVHAQMVSQILSSVLDHQPLYWYWPDWAEALWIWVWAFLGGSLVWHLRRSAWLGLALLAAVAGLTATGWLIFLLTNGWIPLAAPALALLLTSVGLVTYQVFHHSFYDALLGLPNRSLFVVQLQKALRGLPVKSTDAIAVFLLDVNHFKAINESFGHQLGNQLLIQAAARLKICQPAQGTLARIGGDEFSLQYRVETQQQALDLAQHLQQMLATPFELNRSPLTVTFSMGIAFAQSSTHSAENLIQDAHRAMSRARVLKAECYEVFNPKMRSEAVRQFQLEAELRRAIERQEFVLYYQPIIALQTRQLAGFEALVRWQHPQRGLISPAEFIGPAEETGLIVPLGLWILRQACQQMYDWHQAFPQLGPLIISVNLSPRQFNQSDLTQQVAQVLADCHLESCSLKLELTESTAMENVSSTIEQLLKLKALNLKLSLDDFGTGYSSLSYLHHFPTDTLKVDRSFVNRMVETQGDSDIVGTIIALGHKLGMDVIAEGVETEEQCVQLQTFGCQYGQGYLFSKPLPAHTAAAFIAQQVTQLS